MDYYNSLNNLKELKYKIFTSKYSISEIYRFLQDFTKQEKLPYVENNLLVFEIFYLLTLIKDLPPLIKANLNIIPIKILAISNDNNLSFDKGNNKSLIDNNNCLTDLQQKMIKKWSPFAKKDNPTLQYPEPGEYGNVFFTDTETVPGHTYKSNVQIDSEGNIISFLQGPVELTSAENYEEIYTELANQLFDFQK